MKMESSYIKAILQRLENSDNFIAKWRTIISKFFGVMVLVLIFISKSGWSELSPLFGKVLFFTGCVLSGVGALGRLWCSTYIAGYKNDKLITQGPYSICRNPLYLFSAFGALGVALATETIFIPVLITAAFAIYYPYVIKNEEKTLVAQHSETYGDYIQSTPVFFPEFSLFTEPLEYVIKPSVMRRHFLDAIWFIWIFGIVAVIMDLHGAGILPSMISLY